MAPSLRSGLFAISYSIAMIVAIIFGIIGLVIHLRKNKNSNSNLIVWQRLLFALSFFFFCISTLLISTFDYLPWPVTSIINVIFLTIYFQLQFNWGKKMGFLTKCGKMKTKPFHLKGAKVTKRSLLKIALYLFLIIVIFVLCWVFSSLCLTYHPGTFTFASTRPRDYCLDMDKPCHLYLTFGKNVSSQVIVHFQSSKQYKEPVVYYSTDEPDSSFFVNSAEAYYFKEISLHTTRWLYYGYLNNLEPNTTYYFSAGDASNLETTSHTKKFRTGPSDNSDFEFIAGGDVGLDALSLEMILQVINHEPLFFALGGDIAYDNSFPACYGRWDDILSIFEVFFVTKTGYTIPYISAIGNHEAGSTHFPLEVRPPTEVAFYFNYFLHEPLGSREPSSISSYHGHIIGNNSVLLSLDSAITATADGKQYEWIDDQFKFYDLPFKFTMYHVPLYPGSRSPSLQPMESLRKTWVPLFDKHSVTVSFENHDHVYTRTKLMKGDVPSPNGTLYIGDGAFGLVGKIAKDIQLREYVEFATAESHFLLVKVKPTQQILTINAINQHGDYFDNVTVSVN